MKQVKESIGNLYEITEAPQHEILYALLPRILIIIKRSLKLITVIKKIKRNFYILLFKHFHYLYKMILK